MQPGLRLVWLAEQAHLYLALGAAAAKRAWVNGASIGEDSARYLWLAPVTLHAGQNLLEWELVAEQAVNLRAAWALVRDPARFRRPEWLTSPSAPVWDSRVRFTAHFSIPFAPVEGALHVGTAGLCRVLINGTEIGRQGGFDPYGFMMRVQRYTSAAFWQGANTVMIEVDDPGFPVTLVVDMSVRGADGEQVLLSSGPDWQVQRDDGPWAPTALRRIQGGSGPAGELVMALDPQASDLWRRQHPLPGAMWIEDTLADDTVMPVVPDAFMPQERVEWFRWMLPPGATKMNLPLHGAAQVWVDGNQLPIQNGAVVIPPSMTQPRAALLRVVP